MMVSVQLQLNKEKEKENKQSDIQIIQKFWNATKLLIIWEKNTMVRTSKTKQLIKYLD